MHHFNISELEFASTFFKRTWAHYNSSRSRILGIVHLFSYNFPFLFSCPRRFRLVYFFCSEQHFIFHLTVSLLYIFQNFLSLSICLLLSTAKISLVYLVHVLYFFYLCFLNWHSVESWSFWNFLPSDVIVGLIPLSALMNSFLEYMWYEISHQLK